MPTWDGHERRKNGPPDLEAIEASLTRVLGVHAEAHQEEHAFIRILMERERRRTEFRDKLQQQIGGWLAVTLLLGIGYAVWSWVDAHILEIVRRR
jgi:hypothetical protein